MVFVLVVPSAEDDMDATRRRGNKNFRGYRTGSRREVCVTTCADDVRRPLGGLRTARAYLSAGHRIRHQMTDDGARVRAASRESDAGSFQGESVDHVNEATDGMTFELIFCIRITEQLSLSNTDHFHISYSEVALQ
ncbi:hypothetical protein EVAR_77715_1 [Eumeta japonica]|uniref:Uncharacterized protein n=1 Tax=Eumeta variegata TaxID=151549 RepID=A0A4C1TDB7_EUMVA|nr:hypothetical protein EVAR_77715_1 [Eumeta japonica]